jgi:hypothetical protein
MLAVPTALHFPTLLPFNSKKVFESHKIAADEEGDNSASAVEDREKERFEIVSAVNLKEEYHAHFSSNEKEEVISRTWLTTNGPETGGIELTARRPFGWLELAGYHGYLFRGLPIYGYIYIATHHVCFRSTSLVAKSKVSGRLDRPDRTAGDRTLSSSPLYAVPGTDDTADHRHYRCTEGKGISLRLQRIGRGRSWARRTFLRVFEPREEKRDFAPVGGPAGSI